MWDIFTHPSNIIFSIGLSLMLMFATLELILMMLGGGSQQLIEHFLPEEPQTPELKKDRDTHFITKLWCWLYLGRLPLFIWMIIFLACFGLLGLFTQTLYVYFSSENLSAWIISPFCAIACLPLVRFTARRIYKLLPHKDLSAIFSEDLIGLKAMIVLGTAKPQEPAQAKVKDKLGYIHYILVEPENNEVFHQGQIVLITQKTIEGFQAINP